MLKADLFEFEKVYVLNVNNGERFKTYVIKGEKRKHDIILNEAVVQKVQSGDLVFIMAYTCIDSKHYEGFKPKIVFTYDYY